MLDTSEARASAQTQTETRATGVTSDDEFYDCKSNFSSTKASLETTARSEQATPESQGSGAGTAAVEDATAALQQKLHISSPPQRFRSLTGTSGSSDSSADSRACGPVPVRRSVSVKPRSLLPKPSSGSDAHRLVEQRARRAIKAMAEACTSGRSVREVGERTSTRGAVGGRLGGGSSSFSEHLVTRKGLQASTLDHAPLSGRMSEPPEPATRGGAATDDERAVPSAATPEPDSRARSLTGDKAAVLARGASLEARVDQQTRENLQQWIQCFGTVHFDVDQGPTLQLLYPHVPFSSSEREAICFSSMPDSTIYELCDSVYTFNFRVDPVRLGLAKDSIFLHGYVFFRQKRDPLMRRGGFQRAVVVISHLPYHGLFGRLACILGPLYFDLGTAILEAAVHNVASWPRPAAGGAYELPFLGSALSVELPARDASQLLETSRFPLERFDPGEHIMAGVACDGLLRSFRDALDDLWGCWELMILGESLVVLADSPSRCAEAIVGLVDVIFPIRYCGDWRPYFTIQDPDLRAIVSKTRVPPNTVVGVSNPFFSEALGHWPHKLFLGSSERMAQMVGRAGEASSATSPARPGLQTKRRPAVAPDRAFMEQLRSSLRTGRQTPWAANNALRRHFMGLTAQFLSPLDRYFATLIPTVRSSTAIPARETAAWMRRRSASAPADSDCVESLSWFAAPGPLRPWRTDDFMASLASLGISPQLAGRGQATTAADVLASVFSGSGSSSGAVAGSSDTPRRARHGRVSDEWQQLYGQFLTCGNFATWLAHRTEEAQRAVQARFQAELERGDMHAWCRGYDYPLGLGAAQLEAELDEQELATMDLGQGAQHVRHVFYHGAAADERARAERRRRQMLREQQARLAGSERPVYGSDGALVGYTQRAARAPARDAEGPAMPARRKQLGQRAAQARRGAAAMAQAARQLGALAEGSRDGAALRRQLSVLLEYLPAAAGRAFAGLADGF